MVFYQDNPTLFEKAYLPDVLRGHLARVQELVDGIPRDQFLECTEEQIVEHVTPEMTITPLILKEDAMTQAYEEVEVDVSGDRDRVVTEGGPVFTHGTRVLVTVPWTGDPKLWGFTVNVLGLGIQPRGTVRVTDKEGAGLLEIVIEMATDRGGEQFKALLDQNIAGIRSILARQKPLIEDANGKLEKEARAAISKRRTRLEHQDGIARTLNIPLRQSEDAPRITPLDVKRTLKRPLPTPPKDGFTPEPGISERDYEHILCVIRHEIRTFETLPGTFSKHNEEGLRDILLSHLNGHYEGDATGETFRAQGKTDIRIEDRERAAFVAECKVWNGPKSIQDALSQLLGYLTWRDCKASLVIFNLHNARFGEILEKLPAGLQESPFFIRDVGPSQRAGEWRMVFRSKEDETREVVVHIFSANLYHSE